jgi:hypothetical protein
VINDDVIVPLWDIEGGRIVRAASMLKCLKITDGNGNTMLTPEAGIAHLTKRVSIASQQDKSLKVEECYVRVSPELLSEDTVH